jgi:hypothetical protein
MFQKKFVDIIIIVVVVKLVSQSNGIVCTFNKCACFMHIYIYPFTYIFLDIPVKDENKYAHYGAVARSSPPTQISQLYIFKRMVILHYEISRI